MALLKGLFKAAAPEGESTPKQQSIFSVMKGRTLEASCASLAAEAVKVKAMSRSKAKELWVP